MNWLTAEIIPGVNYLELIWLLIGTLASSRLLVVAWKSARDLEIALEPGGTPGRRLVARIGLWVARCLVAVALLFTAAVLPSLAPAGRETRELVLLAAIGSLVGGFALLWIAGEVLLWGRQRFQARYRRRSIK